MDQTVGRLGVVSSLRVLPCHVLKPRQAQVGGVLVAFGNPEIKKQKSFIRHVLWLPVSFTGVSLPVHQVNEHFGILLMLFHLNSVSKNHVQVEDQILDLHKHHIIRAFFHLSHLEKNSPTVFAVTNLLWERCVTQLKVFFGVCQDGL